MKELKNIFNKKKNIGILTILCLFAIGAYVVTSQNQIPLHDGDILVDSKAVVDQEPKKSNEYQSQSLTEMRASIDLERNKLLDTLNNTISTTTNNSQLNSAKEQRDKILTYIEQETEIENIIKTKGLPESLALITDNSVTITVNEQKVEQAWATSICALVMKQTNRPPSEIIVQSIRE